jgi:integrase
MSAHKTNDGRWRVWLDLGSDPETSQRIRKKVEAKTKREAEMKATAIRERHARGENVLDKPRTLKELVDDWLVTLKRQGKAANTISAYRRASKCQLLPLLGASEVPQLRTRAIQTAFNDLAERLSPTYVRMLKTVLVQALNFAIEQGDRTDNPAEKIRIPAVTAKPGRSLTLEEVRAVIAACDGHRYGLAIRFALMGLRRGELPALRWEDFDEVAGTLLVCRQLQRIDGEWKPIPPKRGSIRLLTLGPRAIAALKILRRAQVVEQQTMGWEDSGYIFISTQNGGPCPPSTIYDAFKAICITAGIAPTRLHNCRHTTATVLLADGTDIATVAEVLGHASPLETMKTYAHALPHRVATASQRLEDIFSDDAQDKEKRQRHG